MSLMLLLESALRALGLGAGVWIALRLTGLRDARTETLLWTLVLLASLAMPLLSPWLQARLPGLGLRLAGTPALAAPLSMPASRGGDNLVLMWGVYGLVSAVMLARVATGLVLTLRLYCQARPVTAAWTQGRPVRAGAAIRGPIAFGAAILLPADYCDWPQAKLAAVLAHEQSHVRRGDFFIQLLASVHRALFWFSPFAWWLKAHLCALAESASDAAAVGASGDAASYAEILLDISRRAQFGAGGVAMASGPDIGWRIDRILEDKETLQDAGWRLRVAATAVLLSAAVTLAALHASPAEALPRPIGVPAPGAKPQAIALPQQAGAETAPQRAGRRARHARSGVTYNPRALLEAPTALVLRSIILADGR